MGMVLMKVGDLMRNEYKVKVGDLVKYMSRTVLVVDIDDDWVYGLEAGESSVAKYKAHALYGIGRNPMVSV